MNLFEFYKDISNTKIAKKIGITGAMVRLYKNQTNVPRLNIMLKIYELTNGKVKPQDFYEPFLKKIKLGKK